MGVFSKIGCSEIQGENVIFVHLILLGNHLVIVEDIVLPSQVDNGHVFLFINKTHFFSKNTQSPLTFKLLGMFFDTILKRTILRLDMNTDKKSW